MDNYQKVPFLTHTLIENTR